MSAQYVKACKRKERKTVYFQYSKFQKVHNSHKNSRNMTTLDLELQYCKTKSYAKCLLNMSKHVREKGWKLCISSILSSKRDITPTKIDDTLTWLKVHKKKVTYKISAQFVKACRRKVRKTVTDRRRPGESDGDLERHQHTIIRPVWRRGIKMNSLTFIFVHFLYAIN